MQTGGEDRLRELPNKIDDNAGELFALVLLQEMTGAHDRRMRLALTTGD
jgi:hypothetical protein